MPHCWKSHVAAHMQSQKNLPCWHAESIATDDTTAGEFNCTRISTSIPVSKLILEIRLIHLATNDSPCYQLCYADLLLKYAALLKLVFLHPSQHFFSHVRTFPGLQCLTPGQNTVPWVRLKYHAISSQALYH